MARLATMIIDASKVNTFQQLYQAPNDIVTGSLTLRLIDNSVSTGNTGDIVVGIAVSNNTSPGEEDFLVSSKHIIPSGGYYDEICFLVSPGERIFIKSDTPNTIARLTGVFQY